MKITDKQQVQTVAFGTLKVGTVFQYQHGTFIKIEEHGTLNAFQIPNDPILNTGVCTFGAKSSVKPCTAHLILNEEES